MKRQDSRIHDPLFSFKPLDDYSFKDRTLIRAAGLGLYLFITTFSKTIRYEEPEGWSGLDIAGWESYEEANKRNPNIIIVFWHNRLFLMKEFAADHDGAIITSESFDGELSARVAQRMG